MSAAENARGSSALPRADLALVDRFVGATSDKQRLRITCAKDVQPAAVRWLWPNWLPYGKLAAFDGAPGIGKSTIAIDLIARATRGGPMPGESETFEPICVMIAGVEDGWADTVRPRLDAAGANLERVFFVDAATNGSQGVTVPDDVIELAKRANERNAKWLHIDAIMGTLAQGVNAYSDHEVRRALGPVKDFAEQQDVLVTFIRHPRKAGGTGMNAGGGSVAFGALARVQLFAGFDPSDENEDLNLRRRVLASAKNNLGRTPSARTFAIVDAQNGAGRIDWGETSGLSADQLAAPPVIATPSRPRAKVLAGPTREEQFLENLLGSGQRVPATELKAAARAKGLAWRTVERAAVNVGVAKQRAGFQGGSEWFLPGAVDPLASFAPIPPSE